MERKYYFFDKVAEILVIDSSNIADPFMGVGVSLLTHGEGE
jgi:hypothetical protein